MRSAWLMLPLAVLVAQVARADDLATCAAVADDAARLHCYDQLAGRAAPAVSAPATTAAVQPAVVATVATPAKATETASSDDFGFEMRRALDDENTLNDKVVARKSDARGRLQVTLGNGQVWQQTDSDALSVSVNDTVKIERGFLGAFYMTVNDGNRNVRVRRVE